MRWLALNPFTRPLLRGVVTLLKPWRFALGLVRRRERALPELLDL